jgi:hypothetical protein
MRNLSFLLLLIFLLSNLSPAAGQSVEEPCGTMDYLDMQRAADPSIDQRMREIEEFTAEFIRNHQESGSRSGAPIVTIPVVFHVVYNTPQENISEAQLLSQLRILNEDFRRLNPDTANTPAIFQSVAADIEIEFCLAKLDPIGDPTTGITRTYTPTLSFGGNDNVKFDNQGGKNAWPRDRYLNFWVCDLAGGLLGYAQFPAATGFGNNPPATDGIVCDYAFTGDIGAAQLSGYGGRVATHEVGHWLNLRHIWGDGPCGQDDFVPDTPLAGAPSFPGFPCVFPGADDCDTGAGDLPNMFQNYMDYGDGVCQNMYTKGQKLRMISLFAPGGERESLVYSDACCPEVSACPRPQGSLTALSDSSVRVSWTAQPSTQSVLIQYREAGDLPWTFAPPTTDTSLILNNLALCSQYEVRLQSFCSADSSGFCEALSIETLGCCRAPESNTLEAVGEENSQISWLPVYGANSYEFRHRPFGATMWQIQTVADTNALLDQLLSCTGYEYQVRALCDTLGEQFSAVDTFLTEGCGSCAKLTYCEPSAVADTTYWIDRFVFGPLDVATGNNGGYANFAAFGFPFFVDSTYEFTLYRGTPGTFPQTYHIWIDANQDGDFEDAGEKLFTRTPTTNDQVPGIISLPDTLPLGRTRLRIGSERSFSAANPLQSCEANITGEYEDYCIELKAPCAAPEDLLAAYDSSSQDILLSWASEVYSDSFLLEYRPLSDSSWQTVLVGGGNSYAIDSSLLAPCADYVIRLLTQCEDSNSAAVWSDTVSTRCATGFSAALQAQLRLFPNPNEGSWQLEAPFAIQQVTVFDLMGRQVFSQSGQANRWEIHTPGLSKGLYLVQIQTEAGSLTRRLLME